MNAVPGLTPRGPEPVPSTIQVISPDSPRRVEAEAFIRKVFASRYDARVASFAPELLLLEQAGHIAAAAGWRGAASGRLYLEAYLDAPVQGRIGQLTAHPVARERIVEVGNLASATPGGGVRMIMALADHLHRLDFEWAVFTATQELIGIFTRLGLPPLTLGRADPGRLGSAACDWGRYYDNGPVVVAGRVRLALDRMQRQPEVARG
jgi:hypothetical protein